MIDDLACRRFFKNAQRLNDMGILQLHNVCHWMRYSSKDDGRQREPALRAAIVPFMWLCNCTIGVSHLWGEVEKRILIGSRGNALHAQATGLTCRMCFTLGTAGGQVYDQLGFHSLGSTQSLRPFA